MFNHQRVFMISLILLINATNVLFVQSQSLDKSSNLLFFSFKVGKAPFIMNETKIDALTNEKIDTSPVKSIIHLDQPGMTDITSYTLALSYYKALLNVELTYYGGQGSPITGLVAGIGIKPIKEFSNNFSIHYGGNLNLALFLGNIGEVGERYGDYYLTAPDGNKYYTGSKVDVSGWAYGVSLFTGFNILFTKKFGLTSDFGYNLLTKIDKWEFEVTSKEENDKGESKSCKLPSDGFEQSPSGLELSGFFFRIGLMASF